MIGKSIHITLLFVVVGLLYSQLSLATNVDYTFNTIESAQVYIDSCKTLGTENYNNKQFKKALEYYQEANQIAVDYDIQNETQNKRILKSIGYTYFKLQDYNETIHSLTEYLSNHPNIELKDKHTAMHKLSLAYRHLGDLVSAFEYALQTLEIVEELEDSIYIVKSNYQLGNILAFQDDYHGALEYYKVTLEIAPYLKNNPRLLYSSYGAIGNIYNKLDSIDVALEYNTKALDYAHEINYKIGVTYSHHNIGNDHFKLKDFEKALFHHLTSLKIKQEINDKWGMSSSYRMIGNIYTEMGKYKKAEYNLNLAEKMAKEINAKPMLSEIYDIYTKLFNKTKNYQQANKYLNLYVTTKDEIRRETALARSKYSKSKYEINKRDKEINLLKLGKKEQELKMRTFSYILLAIFPFIVLLIFAYNRLRKANNLLEGKNKLIEKQNIALEESNKELEQFAYVASHDMREPIRTIRSFNSLLKRRYHDVLGERGLEFVNFIDDASNRMDIMLTDLLDYSRVNTKDKNKSIINLTDTAFLAAKNLTNKLETEGVKLNVSSLPNVKVNPIQMERLFQNLISNGVKYNDKEEKTINIDYKKNGKAYIISVKDNGIGIDPEYKDKVFEIFRRLHGTSEYEGSGIGLATCKKIVEKHEGKIWIDSEPEQGTTVYFTIPFHNKHQEVELVA